MSAFLENSGPASASSVQSAVAGRASAPIGIRPTGLLLGIGDGRNGLGVLQRGCGSELAVGHRNVPVVAEDVVHAAVAVHREESDRGEVVSGRPARAVAPTAAAGSAEGVREDIHGEFSRNCLVDYNKYDSMHAVLPRALVQPVPLGADRDEHLSVVRNHRLPEADLLQAAERLRGGRTLGGMRCRHWRLSRRHVHVHHRNQGTQGVLVGLAVFGRFRGGGQGSEVSVACGCDLFSDDFKVRSYTEMIEYFTETVGTVNDNLKY